MNPNEHPADTAALLGACPVPISDCKEIVLAHGSGGRLSQQLLQRIVDVLSGEQLPRIC